MSSDFSGHLLVVVIISCGVYMRQNIVVFTGAGISNFESMIFFGCGLRSRSDRR